MDHVLTINVILLVFLICIFCGLPEFLRIDLAVIPCISIKVYWIVVFLGFKEGLGIVCNCFKTLSTSLYILPYERMYLFLKGF